MARFLVDEDLPRSLAAALRTRGYDATDVRDQGMRGAPDASVFRFAQKRGFVVVTADVEFGNELVYPPATHCGIILARIPGALPASILVETIVAGIDALRAEDLSATVVVLEPGRLRIRRTAR
jgi:predicted nuclease of predicted toxin-antitoxin system